MEALIEAALSADVSSGSAAMTPQSDLKPFHVGCRSQRSILFPVNLASNVVTAVSLV